MAGVLGVDVGQAELVAAVWEGGPGRVLGTFPNTLDGFLALRTAFGSTAPLRLVLEPTGGYELALAAWAVEQGWVVCRPNPRQVRDWAKSQGRRAKTDRQDALLLAHYGAEHDLPAWTALPSEVEELESLLRRRDDVEQLLRQERNRQQQLAQRPRVARAVPPSLNKVIGALEEALRELDEAIAAHQQQHPALAEAVQRVRTVPGVGERNSLWLVVVLYRWQVLTGGKGDAKGLTAFVGLDPTVHESGKSVRGPRTISRMGMAQVRRLLFMGALGGVRGKGNNPLRDFHQRLIAAHKPKVVAYVAAARKILCWAWAVFQHQTTFDPAKAAAKAAATS
jgi:transposase